jgi:hypothetical protein
MYLSILRNVACVLFDHKYHTVVLFTIQSQFPIKINILTVGYFHKCFNKNDQQLLKGRAMAQAVSRRPPTAEARVRSRASPCGICGGQSGTGTGFSFP